MIATVLLLLALSQSANQIWPTPNVCHTVPSGDDCNSCTECWDGNESHLTVCTLVYCVRHEPTPDWVYAIENADAYSESAAQGDPNFWQPVLDVRKLEGR